MMIYYQPGEEFWHEGDVYKRQGMHFESCQLTESRMYIKVVNTRLEAEVVPGDIVQSGIIISNSEDPFFCR